MKRRNRALSYRINFSRRSILLFASQFGLFFKVNYHKTNNKIEKKIEKILTMDGGEVWHNEHLKFYGGTVVVQFKITQKKESGFTT